MKGLALIYLVLFLEMLKSFILKRNLIKFYNNKRKKNTIKQSINDWEKNELV